jgi:hypothetical protein
VSSRLLFEPKIGVRQQATECAIDPRRGVWLTRVSDLAQAFFQLLALEVVG